MSLKIKLGVIAFVLGICTSEIILNTSSMGTEISSYLLSQELSNDTRFSQKKKHLDAERLLNLCREHLDQNKNIQAVKSCKKSAVFHQKNEDNLGNAKSLINVGLAYERLKKYKNAISSTKLALSLLNNINDQNTKALALKLLERSNKSLGKRNLAREFRDLAQPFFDKQGKADNHKKRGSQLFKEGEYSLAIQSWNEALKIYKEISDFQFASKTLRSCLKSCFTPCISHREGF